MPNPPAPDGDLGPELTPKPDFTVWVQPEALVKSKGFGARAYWVFGTKLNPRIRLRIKLGGVMYRITLQPIGKESWPQRSVLNRHLMTEAAMAAQDFGAPVGIEEGDTHEGTGSDER